MCFCPNWVVEFLRFVHLCLSSNLGKILAIIYQLSFPLSYLYIRDSH
jgi:hypothetical protein